MFISIALIVFVAGLGLFFVARMHVVGVITGAVGLSLMGAVNIPYLTPAVQWVNGLI